MTRRATVVKEMQVGGANRRLDFGPGRELQIRIHAGNPDIACADAKHEHLLIPELLGDHHGSLQADLAGVTRRANADVLRAYWPVIRPVG
jgi:hypothetical protein